MLRTRAALIASLTICISNGCQSIPVTTRESDCALFKNGEPIREETVRERASANGFELSEDSVLESESASPALPGLKIFILRKNLNSKNEIIDQKMPARRLLVRLQSRGVTQVRCTDVHEKLGD